LGAVFVVGDVADPVEAVLDGPVAVDEAVEVRGVRVGGGEARDVDAVLDAGAFVSERR